MAFPHLSFKLSQEAFKSIFQMSVNVLLVLLVVYWGRGQIVGVGGQFTAERDMTYRRQDRGLCLLGSTVAGTPTNGIPVVSPIICTDKCNYQPDCIGFNFFEGNSTCQLKTYLSQATFDKNAIAIPGCTFYYRV